MKDCAAATDNAGSSLPRPALCLLIAVIVGLLAVLSTVAVFLTRQRQSRDIISRVEMLGGSIVYDYQVAKRTSPPGPAILRELLGDNAFAHPQFVHMSSPIKDEDLRLLTELTRLHEVWVNGQMVTDAGMRVLATLPMLRCVIRDDTSVSSIGFEDLSEVASLKSICLTGNSVTDETLLSLRR